MKTANKTSNKKTAKKSKTTKNDLRRLEEIKNPIREYLETKPMVIRELAWKLSVTEHSIRNWMSKSTSPSTVNRINMAQEFGISLRKFNKLWDEWERWD